MTIKRIEDSRNLVSRALRRGSALSVARHGVYATMEDRKYFKPLRMAPTVIKNDSDGSICMACAVGALYLGLDDMPAEPEKRVAYVEGRTVGGREGIVGLVSSKLGVDLDSIEVDDPTEKGNRAPLGSLIEDLFEGHDWSRARIATWLDGLKELNELVPVKGQVDAA